MIPWRIGGDTDHGEPSVQQTPERSLAAVLDLEPGTVNLVGVEGAEALDLTREPLAFQQAPRGVAVAARSRGAEREVDQRTPYQRGCDRPSGTPADLAESRGFPSPGSLPRHRRLDPGRHGRRDHHLRGIVDEAELPEGADACYQARLEGSEKRAKTIHCVRMREPDDSVRMVSLLFTEAKGPGTLGPASDFDARADSYLGTLRLP